MLRCHVQLHYTTMISTIHRRPTATTFWRTLCTSYSSKYLSCLTCKLVKLGRVVFTRSRRQTNKTWNSTSVWCSSSLNMSWHTPPAATWRLTMTLHHIAIPHLCHYEKYNVIQKNRRTLYIAMPPEDDQEMAVVDRYMVKLRWVVSGLCSYTDRPTHKQAHHNSLPGAE